MLGRGAAGQAGAPQALLPAVAAAAIEGSDGEPPPPALTRGRLLTRRHAACAHAGRGGQHGAQHGRGGQGAIMHAGVVMRAHVIGGGGKGGQRGDGTHNT